ncbi:MULTISPECIES: NADH-quinone oxidoreductase subunit N [Halomicrobium]|uniref:Proton-translocating NADH-quinone oxidoreductase, chain N n=2 Tax=Halomicrobium mukohataei TaxID=57705 RepID=C7P4L8_HALMD|nr:MULTISPECIES: NADH-quinone oxidoreductase subunit N [Halomicrobium]ACV48040.1 proton-translocating NADH-quinone oxidoreductase, chain N [Halomicrobium mukohataei DSM 12286]QCD66473.1 NADH-quinone oxidoreductase subunit N [Halomicrobium mukohataei]QFR21279.1 NADH-quinone oxidoreductase subunit NuoN [Halomicrobium sp. ZPS1]
MVQLPTWTALSPTLLLGLTAIVLLLVDSIDPDSSNNELLAGVAGLGSIAAAATSVWFIVAGTGLPAENGELISLFDDQLVVDQMALFFSFLVASVLTLVVVASYDYMADKARQAKYYSLTVMAATGMSLLGSANGLAVAFVALELASLPSYALVAILKTNKGSVEAALKYFLVGALSSGVFLYGISLVYGATGSLQFDAVAAALTDGVPAGILGIGVLMIVGGVAFKTASVPFHFWAPEAYEGAPAPISAFLSSASKAAGFVLAFRVFATALMGDAVLAVVDWVLVFQVLAIVTMFVGNFAAATQENVKRMLAYSSVGHAGYVLIGLAALTGGSSDAYVLGSGMMHLLVYGFMNTGAFLFIALVEYWDIGRTFEDYNGLATQAPLACAAMTVFLFSLAGLPIGGGFFSKFNLLMATVRSGTWFLGAALIVNSALSLYYYTRVVKAMWIEEPASGLEIERYPIGLYTAVLVAALVTVLLLPGFDAVSQTAETAASLL